MRKLTFFDATLLQGGAERVISIITKELAADDELQIEIVLWYSAQPFYEIDSRVKVILIPEETKSDVFMKKLIWLHNYIKNDTDAIISFLAPINMIAIVAHWFTGKKIIVADRNDPSKVPVNKIVRKIRDILYMFADGVVLQTKKNQEYFSKRVKKKSTVIYNPVNLGKYAGISLNEDKESRIVSVGRLTPQKIQKMLRRAFATVLEYFPQYQLEIYGEESSYKVELEALIEQLNIQEHVMLAGSVTDLHERIKNAKLFVLSSNYEGMPNALIEAMCMGLPVISTKVSGATDLIEHRKNGILIEEEDQEVLEKAVQELLENQDMLEKIAKDAVMLNEKLESSRIVQQWGEFIEEKCFGR